MCGWIPDIQWVLNRVMICNLSFTGHTAARKLPCYRGRRPEAQIRFMHNANVSEIVTVTLKALDRQESLSCSQKAAVFSLFSASSCVLGIAAIAAPGILLNVVLPGIPASPNDEMLLQLAGGTMAISCLAESCLKVHDHVHESAQTLRSVCLSDTGSVPFGIRMQPRVTCWDHRHTGSLC